MEKKYFIVTCHGWSASNWLAHALNLHPEIICTHSSRNVIANKKDLQSNENLKKNIHQLHSGYFLRQNRGIDDAYDEIVSYGDAKYYGSVHVYRLRDLPVVFEKYGDYSRNFTVVNMLRDPMSLVWSGYGQFKDLFLYDINELYWTLKKVMDHGQKFVHDIGNRFNINIGETDNLAFIGACSVLLSLKLDIDAIDKVKNIPSLDYRGTIKMEDVTKSEDSISKLLSDLTNNEIYVDQRYLSEVYNTGIINKHKIDKKFISPSERFQTLPEWRKEVLLYFMERFSIIENYEKLGYDLSYLKQ